MLSIFAHLQGACFLFQFQNLNKAADRESVDVAGRIFD
jgi:hypothetical protein